MADTEAIIYQVIILFFYFILWCDMHCLVRNFTLFSIAPTKHSTFSACNILSEKSKKYIECSRAQLRKRVWRVAFVSFYACNVHV